MNSAPSFSEADNSNQLKEKIMQALSTEELAKYRTDGVIIPSSGLGPDIVEELQLKLDSFFLEQGITDADYVPDIIDRDPSWLRFGAMPEILDAVSQIIGDDIILWGSALFCKAATHL